MLPKDKAGLVCENNEDLDVDWEVPLRGLLLEPIFAAPHVNACLSSHEEDFKPEASNI